MQDFQYASFVNPYAGSMADEIARSGDAQARAAMAIGQAQARAHAVSGAAWGNAITTIGQIPIEVAKTQAVQTENKLRQEELQQTIEQRQAVQAQRVAVLGGRLAGVSSSPEVFADRVKQAMSSGLLHPAIGQHMLQQVSTVGADGWPALQKSYIDFADSFAALTTLKPGEHAGIMSAGGGFKDVASVPETKVVPPGATVGSDTGWAFTPEYTAPKTEVVNGQPVSVTPQGATPLGPAIPKQETASEAAERQAQTLKLTREAAEIDQKLAGTTPLSQKDRAELELRRAQIALETARNDRVERNESPSSPRYQSQLENQYRTLAHAVISSRSGVLGVEDAKVTAAKHLITMFDANTDKNGNINIPPQAYQELASGLASLVNPKGGGTDTQINELKAATAKGDLGKLAQYLTGSNFNGTTQEIAKYLREQVERQGLQAEANREKELDFIRAGRPTDLEPARAQGIERGLAGLNSMKDVGVGVPKDGTLGEVNGTPAVWKQNGAKGPGWYPR